jgi:hypothetical protein
MKTKDRKTISHPAIDRHRVFLLFLLFVAITLSCETLSPKPTSGEVPKMEPPSAKKEVSSNTEKVLKPVGFVNQGTLNAMIMPCTWVPAGSQEPAPPPSASTISTHSGAPGLWPNPSRFLSLPIGIYTWCIQWDEGDRDGDGKIDYFYFINNRPVTLTQEDNDDHEFAREVLFSAPPGPGTETFSGTCDQAPACSYGAGVMAYLVTEAFTKDFEGSGELSGVEYHAASLSLFIDPTTTDWIAWNNIPGVTLGRDTRPGEAFLGPGGIGTDDYIALIIVNPDGQTLTVELDQNDARGRWEGPQNVIFGSADVAPDVFRQYPSFADPPGKEFFIDEAGSHNDIFTKAGEYEFQFSFRNRFTNSASHPDIYLLVSSH